MSNGTIATITFGGMPVSFESFSIVDSSGVTPASGMLVFDPQNGIPPRIGDLAIYFNSQLTVTYKTCMIDSIDFESGSGGQVAMARLVDERWFWSKYTITGWYNRVLPDGTIDPNHQKNPQQLATLCFQAIGVQAFDVSLLPNSNFPEVKWDYTRADKALEQLVTLLGCRIVPMRSLQLWKIWPNGQGQPLPDGYPYQDPGIGLYPKVIPDFIKIVSAPWRYQVFLPLQAVGKEIDLSWQPVNNLSYVKPSGSAEDGYGLGSGKFDGFLSLAARKVPTPAGTLNSGNVRFFVADGTKTSPMELAASSVWRSWNVDLSQIPGSTTNSNGEYTAQLPGFPYPVTARQLNLSNSLVQSWTDYLGALHERPAFVCGSFWGTKADKANNNNYPPGTRIDPQAPIAGVGLDEGVSFSMSLDAFDMTRSIISTSQAMVRYNGNSKYGSAILQLCCAVQIRDPDTWQPIREEFTFPTGNGPNTNTYDTVLRDDIQPWTITKYNPLLPRNNPPTYTTNYAFVQQMAQYYAQAKMAEYQIVETAKRTYIGIFPIDMDGLTVQITYQINNTSGHSTLASQGTEHSYYTPAFDQRRAELARQSIGDTMDYWRYEGERRRQMIGTFNA